MKTSKFSETQIVSILKQQDAGLKVADICREHGISQATFYKWRSKYGGMDASMLRRVKELEAESLEGLGVVFSSDVEFLGAVGIGWHWSGAKP